MKIGNVNDLDDLIQYLENWTTFGADPDAYDVNGMFHLLKACLRNLNRYTIDGDFDEIGDVFEDLEVSALEKLLAKIKSSQ